MISGSRGGRRPSRGLWIRKTYGIYEKRVQKNICRIGTGALPSGGSEGFWEPPL